MKSLAKSCKILHKRERSPNKSHRQTERVNTTTNKQGKCVEVKTYTDSYALDGSGPIRQELVTSIRISVKSFSKSKLMLLLLHHNESFPQTDEDFVKILRKQKKRRSILNVKPINEQMNKSLTADLHTKDRINFSN